VFKTNRQRWPFFVVVMVILPDYLHCIWTLPSKGADFFGRRYDIKARFAAQIPGGERLLKAKGGMRLAFPPYGPARFFTPLRSVQNDKIIYCSLTASSYQMRVI
jgi:hypothetical protein